MILEVRLRPIDYIDQPHKDRTVERIERTVEWVESQDRPFTIGQCWRSVYGHYQCVQQTIRSLAKAGLITQVNPGSKPKLWIRFDRRT